jgi:glycogen synthase
MDLKVLMFGWEFPPFISGGLGEACYGLTKGLCNKDVQVTFVLPFAKVDSGSCSHVKMILASKVNEKSDEFVDNLKVHEINSLLRGYLKNEQYVRELHEICKTKKNNSKANPEKIEVYGKNLYQEVQRFAQKSREIAKNEEFDVIHAHDWMTYKAAINVKEMTGKPMVLHIHNTVFDRYGNDGNSYEYQIEKEGFTKADMIFAVSEWTRQKVIHNYGIEPEKVKVVHNGITFADSTEEFNIKKAKKEKIVLSLGRLTQQKGMMQLLWSAKKVIDTDPSIKFIIAGDGDMKEQLIQETVNLGIIENVVFTGWVTRAEAIKAYKAADLFIMPSISEPFGLTPLESMNLRTPTLISKQSGVSEVIKHCLKVDFWDINQMSSKILNVLKYEPLHKELSQNGFNESFQINWDTPAQKCINFYTSLIR